MTIDDLGYEYEKCLGAGEFFESAGYQNETRISSCSECHGVGFVFTDAGRKLAKFLRAATIYSKLTE